MTTSPRPDRRRAALLVAMLALTGCAGAPPPAVAPSSAVAPPAAVAPSPTASAAVQRIELSVTGGTVAGGVARIAVPLGATVDLVVTSDVADEVHLHGYDRSSFVTAGASANLRFVADLPGVFEVELEKRGMQLAQLQVS